MTRAAEHGIMVSKLWGDSGAYRGALAYILSRHLAHHAPVLLGRYF